MHDSETQRTISRHVLPAQMNEENIPPTLSAFSRPITTCACTSICGRGRIFHFFSHALPCTFLLPYTAAPRPWKVHASLSPCQPSIPVAVKVNIWQISILAFFSFSNQIARLVLACRPSTRISFSKELQGLMVRYKNLVSLAIGSSTR